MDTVKRVLPVIVLGVALFAAIAVFADKDNASTPAQEEEAVRSLVLAFGETLKNISLTAPQEQAAESIREEYAPFVTQELLDTWAAMPLMAPGRLTSSPWPERIEIAKINKINKSYLVEGDIILVTSAELTEGGNAGVQEVVLTVEKRDGEWRIAEFEAKKVGWITHTNEDPAFSVSYPEAFEFSVGAPAGREAGFWSELSEAGGETFATLTLPGTFMPESNFSEARIMFGASDQAAAVEDCSTYTGNRAETEDAQIQDQPFTRIETADAGAGNFYETVSYRIVHNDACFAIEYVIHSTNINNYPEGTVEEFDKEEVVRLLEEVVHTFTF